MQTCPKCGMNRTPLRHGSITQWISICNCLSESGANEEIAQVEVCSSCGKKLTKGRDGSFTQWVFRHDLCHCEHQRPDLPLRIDRQNSTISDHIESESEAILREDEQGLNMPEGSFPVERYLPRKELGRGATGSVYLCRDRMLAKDVAVKILNKVTAFELVSFQMEARATSKLDHVNIVKMFDFGATESGVPFMVMDYLDGSNLQEYIVVNGPLSVSQAVSVFSQACLAFDYAHKQGLYHRDIQTRNLMIRKDSSADLQVKVIDFGIASRKMDETETIQIESRADGSGEALVGTPYYMAPDQVLGTTFDQRSEIYSLGCVIFEALTGYPPFQGSTALETIAFHAKKTPPTLREFGRNNFPSDLEAIVARCLAKKKSERYADMHALGIAFAECRLNPEDYIAGATTGLSSQYGDSRYGKLIGVLVGLALISIVGFLIFSIFTERDVSQTETKKYIFGDLGMNDSTNKVMTNENGPLVSSHKIDGGLAADCYDVGDEDLKQLEGKRMKGHRLRSLNLERNNITDECVEAIASVKGLKMVSLQHCPGISQAGVVRLRKSMPGIVITYP